MNRLRCPSCRCSDVGAVDGVYRCDDCGARFWRSNPLEWPGHETPSELPVGNSALAAVSLPQAKAEESAGTAGISSLAEIETVEAKPASSMVAYS